MDDRIRRVARADVNEFDGAIHFLAKPIGEVHQKARGGGRLDRMHVARIAVSKVELQVHIRSDRRVCDATKASRRGAAEMSPLRRRQVTEHSVVCATHRTTYNSFRNSEFIRGRRTLLNVNFPDRSMTARSDVEEVAADDVA